MGGTLISGQCYRYQDRLFQFWCLCNYETAVRFTNLLTNELEHDTYHYKEARDWIPMSEMEVLAWVSRA